MPSTGGEEDNACHAHGQSGDTLLETTSRVQNVYIMSCQNRQTLSPTGLAQYLKGEISRLIRTQGNSLRRDSNCWVGALSQGAHEQVWKPACIPYSDDYPGRAVEFHLRIAHCSPVTTNPHGCDLKNVEADRLTK
jgi:hypothetical protein